MFKFKILIIIKWYFVTILIGILLEMVGICIAFPVLLGVFMVFMPKSPYFLIGKVILNSYLLFNRIWNILTLDCMLILFQFYFQATWISLKYFLFKDKEGEAKTSLERLRGKSCDVSRELQVIKVNKTNKYRKSRPPILLLGI